MNNKSLEIKKKNPILRYAFIFIGLILLFYSIYGTKWFFDLVIMPAASGYAFLCHGILNLMGYDTLHKGTSIISDQLSLNIFLGCDGIEGMALFVLAVLALHTSWVKKFKGIFFGLLVLILTNIFRIISLFFIGIYWPSAFDFFHIQFWQVAFILIAGILWIVWANHVVEKPTFVNG